MAKAKKQVKKTTSNQSFSNELNIYQKIGMVQAKANQSFKDKHHESFTEHKILDLLNPLLEEAKLTLSFSDDAERDFFYEKTETGHLVRYLKIATLTNSEKNEEQLEFRFWAIGQNMDVAKAKGSAETYAIKYFLTKLFLIPVVDNLDPESKNLVRIKY